MSYMTKIEGVPDSDSAKPGMAYFAGTGPVDGRCGTCKFRGLTRVSRSSEKTYRTQGCQIVRTMSGRYGPAVDKEWPACKYYEKKKK